MPTLRFPSDLKCVKEASGRILALLKGLELNSSTLFDIRLCFEEAMINAICYGNKENPELTVDVEVDKKDDRIEIVIKDQGKGFDYANCQDPTTEENLIKPRGRGIFIIRKLMDQVFFEHKGSCLRMVKKIE